MPSIRETEESNPEKKQCVKDKFKQICIRIGKSKKPCNASTIHEKRNSYSAKRLPRIPIHPQERTEKELSKLMDQKHIVKLGKCLGENFISPIAVTVKNGQRVKLALDSKKINKFIHKKYQMPNQEFLQNKIKPDSKNYTLFSTLDLRAST